MSEKWACQQEVENIMQDLVWQIETAEAERDRYKAALEYILGVNKDQLVARAAREALEYK